jgi:spore coat polysaccharide biosynthesis protein SpsF (cytidylyltransferase family)
MKRNGTIIIQARTGSKRFPGKSLYAFKEKPALTHLLEGLLSEFSRSEILVATSFEVQDTVIEELCFSLNVACYRGPEDNVALRFIGACETALTPYIVRICGDSPLLPPKVAREVLELAVKEDADLATTTILPKFPGGFNVEAIKREVFLNAYSDFKKEQLEHITKYFYDNIDRYKIASLPCSIPNSESYKFSFDNDDDRVRLERIFTEMTKPHFEYSLEEKCEIYRRLFIDGK